jgi:Na+/proline symporter
MTLAATIAVVGALLVPGVLYTCIAFRTRREIGSIFDFLPFTRHLKAGSVGATVVAAGMSMATVMVALVNLAPALGSALFITVATFVMGFLLLILATPRIMRLNSRNLVLQSFLGDRYKSSGVRITASAFTIVGYLSIFSMEILVSVTLLKPFFGSAILAFAVVYLAFLLIYTVMSGFRGVVATDRWQLSFILLGLFALTAVVVVGFVGSDTNVEWREHAANLLGQWQAPMSFLIGIALMNIPAPLSDAATWQRVCAGRDAATSRRGLWSACGFFAFLWGALILLGIALSGDPAIVAKWDPNTEALLTAVLASLQSGPVRIAILFLLIVGLFSAMISTADSLLIAATQVALNGFSRHERLVDAPQNSLYFARWLVVLLGVGAFSIFVIFQLVGLNVVQLVFAIYGAQLALFPATALCVFFADRMALPPLRFFVIASIGLGFTAAWGTAIWGHVIESADATYYAPATGLATAIAVLLIGLVALRLRTQNAGANNEI